MKRARSELSSLVRVALLTLLAVPLPIRGQVVTRTPAANPGLIWTFDAGG